MSKIKKPYLGLLLIALSSSLVACSPPAQPIMRPQASQMKSIAELATMECYFHNVAKYTEKDAAGILLWKKDKHFWIEYSGIVKIGIDPSLLVVEVKEDNVTIQLPDAKVLDNKVHPTSLSKDSFIVGKNSAEITGEDEILAFKEAQNNMVLAASQDSVLMANAQERAKKLLEEYIVNIGEAVNKKYSITWLDGSGLGTKTETGAGAGTGTGLTDTSEEPSDSENTKTETN